MLRGEPSSRQACFEGGLPRGRPASREVFLEGGLLRGGLPRGRPSSREVFFFIRGSLASRVTFLKGGLLRGGPYLPRGGLPRRLEGACFEGGLPRGRLPRGGSSSSDPPRALSFSKINRRTVDNRTVFAQRSTPLSPGSLFAVSFPSLRPSPSTSPLVRLVCVSDRLRRFTAGVGAPVGHAER